MFQWRERNTVAIVGALVVACIGVASLTSRRSPTVIDPPSVSDTLPTRLSDAEFWETIEAFSEPGGSFRSENLLSNEDKFQDVIPKVKERIEPGGIYIGVGPEQNFTYVLAFEPKLSFIVDIRRLNMLEHLLYKALFELSKDRADFVSHLFSRPRPKGLNADSSVGELFEAYDSVTADLSLLQANEDAVLRHLIGMHQFPVSEEDQIQIRYVMSTFFREGPDLSYSFSGSSYQGTLGMPKYKALMTGSDSRGTQWGFLASEEQFLRIQDIQRKNLIVPLVGDFAGPRTLRAVGRYISEHHAVLSVFYTSNVEMYLFQQGDEWERFYDNVATLPINSASAFIRFAAGRGSRGTVRDFFPMRSQRWSPVRDVIDAVRAGKVDDYSGVLDLSE